MEALVIYLLIFGPALFGLAALIAGILVLRRRAPGGKRETVQTLIGVSLVVVGLGFGACYGVVYLG